MTAEEQWRLTYESCEIGDFILYEWESLYGTPFPRRDLTLQEKMAVLHGIAKQAKQWRETQ